MGDVEGWGGISRYPIVVGAVAGLVTGLAGIVVGVFVSRVVAGAVLGAVGGGVTAASLSERETVREVGNAVAADVLSSILFFLLVLCVSLLSAAFSGQIAFTSAVSLSTAYLLFGGLFAVPVAIISIAIAGFSGLLTSIVKRILYRS